MTFVVKHFDRYNLFQINSVCKATRYFWKGKQGVFMAPCFEFEVLLLKKNTITRFYHTTRPKYDR